MRVPREFRESDVGDQSGKTALITGANTGLGFEAARVLAGHGAHVLLGCRSRPRAEQACARIRALHPEAQLEIIELDLGDLDCVRRAATQVGARAQLDLLINNAGIMMPPRALTRDGFESQFGVNHLGHFALTGLLLPVLERAPAARIVITSSSGHKAGKIEFDDLDATRSYSPGKRYAMSKLANLLHMYELDRRLRARAAKTLAVGVHPGGSATELARNVGGLMALLMPLFAPFVSAPAEGAWSTLLAATAAGVEGGQYFGPGGMLEMRGPARQVDSTARSKDPQLAARLWDVSVELTGVDPGI